MRRALGRLFATGWAQRRAALAGGLLCVLALLSFGVTKRALPPFAGVDSPVLSALTVALGGSRGILAEVLWWRISELQQQSRFAEILPLTDLLVTLEPTSADAWAYNAWNLAYNISVAYRDAEERWRWVCRGVRLLERGLRILPQSEVLLRQMGWLWEDKIGGAQDGAGAYYRAHLEDLGLPPEAEAFARQAGLSPDWHNPRVHALYWYAQANHAPDMLRTLSLLLREPGQAAWIPFFLKVVRQAWGDLAPEHQGQIMAFLAELAARYPGERAALAAFVQEAKR